MRRGPFLLLTALLVTAGLALLGGLPLPAATGPGAPTLNEELKAIRTTALDPQQCYRVRDVFLEREDAKFYFTDGYLLFAEPYQDRTIAALFLAIDPVDEGEILLIPPSARERKSVSRFTGEPILNQKFRTALMLFSDDTGDALRTSLATASVATLDPARGAELARRWTPVMQNLLDLLAVRVVFDATSAWDPAHGFFAAIISGGPKGRFEVVIDPHVEEQMSVGQSVWRDGRSYYETWCRFAGRSFRDGARKQARDDSRLDNYHIESRLDPDLTMQVVAKADFVPNSTSQRGFGFELSERLKMEKLLLDGEPLEFVQVRGPNSSHARQRSNDLVAFVLPQPPAPGARHKIEFHYKGTVINHAGDGVYYVGSRGSWYPRRRAQFTNYELVFHHPEDLDLVATGELIESSREAGLRTSRFRAASPIRLAGFNLGRYERVSREVGGHTLEVCANRGVENRLQPRPRMVLVPTPEPGRRSRRTITSTSSLITKKDSPSPPSPADRLDLVADRTAGAFSYFLERLGPPPTKKIVISPIPGDFGQGFPGLVYASTLSYFQAQDAPLNNLTPAQRLFYQEILPAHEISHQWWGNVLAIQSLSDDWLMEGLATYSALLYLEHRHGRGVMDTVLAGYRTALLARNDQGEPVDSAGPVVLGHRLRSSQFPDAARVLVYEKGAWIVHMLRGAMGDEGFFQLLRELCTKYRQQRLSTEEFRAEAAHLLPASYPDAELREFFEQWVYGTGIPKLRLEHSMEAKGSKARLVLRLYQESVPTTFRVVVPVKIETAGGDSIVKMIPTDGELTEVRVALKGQPARVVLDPEGFLLRE